MRHPGARSRIWCTALQKTRFRYCWALLLLLVPLAWLVSYAGTISRSVPGLSADATVLTTTTAVIAPANVLANDIFVSIFSEVGSCLSRLAADREPQTVQTLRMQPQPAK